VTRSHSVDRTSDMFWLLKLVLEVSCQCWLKIPCSQRHVQLMILLLLVILCSLLSLRLLSLHWCCRLADRQGIQTVKIPLQKLCRLTVHFKCHYIYSVSLSATKPCPAYVPEIKFKTEFFWLGTRSPCAGSKAVTIGPLHFLVRCCIRCPNLALAFTSSPGLSSINGC